MNKFYLNRAVFGKSVRYLNSVMKPFLIRGNTGVCLHLGFEPDIPEFEITAQEHEFCPITVHHFVSFFVICYHSNL